MKNLFVLILVVSSFAQAGVKEGGGAEWNIIQCKATAPNGQMLSLKVCLTGETNREGKYEIIPCGQDRLPYVTIQRSTSVAAGSRVIETMKIPDILFSVDWTERNFSLHMKDSKMGEMSLIRLLKNGYDGGTTWDLDLQSMKYKLRSVSCDFGTN